MPKKQNWTGYHRNLVKQHAITARTIPPEIHPDAPGSDYLLATIQDEKNKHDQFIWTTAATNLPPKEFNRNYRKTHKSFCKECNQLEKAQMKAAREERDRREAAALTLAGISTTTTAPVQGAAATLTDRLTASATGRPMASSDNSVVGMEIRAPDGDDGTMSMASNVSSHYLSQVSGSFYHPDNMTVEDAQYEEEFAAKLLESEEDAAKEQDDRIAKMQQDIDKTNKLDQESELNMKTVSLKVIDKRDARTQQLTNAHAEALLTPHRKADARRALLLTQRQRRYVEKRQSTMGRMSTQSSTLFSFGATPTKSSTPFSLVATSTQSSAPTSFEEATPAIEDGTLALENVGNDPPAALTLDHEIHKAPVKAKVTFSDSNSYSTPLKSALKKSNKVSFKAEITEIAPEFVDPVSPNVTVRRKKSRSKSVRKPVEEIGAGLENVKPSASAHVASGTTGSRAHATENEAGKKKHTPKAPVETDDGVVDSKPATKTPTTSGVRASARKRTANPKYKY